MWVVHNYVTNDSCKKYGRYIEGKKKILGGGVERCVHHPKKLHAELTFALHILYTSSTHYLTIWYL